MHLRKRVKRNSTSSAEESREQAEKTKSFMITKREEEEIESLEAEVDPDDSIHEMIDVENDAIIQVEEGRASTSSRQTLLDTPNISLQSHNVDDKPKYIMRKIPRNTWVSRRSQNFNPVDTILGFSKTGKRERVLAPDAKDPSFSFTGNHKLFPYPVYYDIIMRAKHDPSIISLDIPKLRPSAGSIIVYDCKGADHYRQIHNDGYRWGRSKGVKLLQSVGNKLVRTYHFLFSPQNPAGDPAFKKYRFNLKDDPYGILVFHYIGDEKRALAVSEKCMDKTNAMVLLERSRQDIEAPPLLNLIPVAELNNNATEDERERYRQIIFENVQTIQRNLAFENGEPFIDKVELDENGNVGAVILFCHPLMDQLIGVASYLQQSNPFRTVLLFYHTEPCSSEFYLSTLTFVHPFFEGDQIIPVAFMLSSSSSPSRQADHDFFLSTICDRFNDLQNGRFVVVTGQNLHFTPEAFPVAEHFRCWIDFKRIKMAYLESNTEVDQNLSEYANDMNILMSCQTEKKFDEVWARISSCKRYTDYPEIMNYFVNVWIDFKFSSAIWILKPAGVPEAEKGIIWRGSNDLKKVVAQLCENNAQADIIIISLFLLSNAYRRLFIAGLHQCGGWRLKKCYRGRFQQSHLRLPKLPYAPAMENIVLTAFKYCPDRSYKNNHVTISDVIPNTDSNVYNPSNCAASSSISNSRLWSPQDTSAYRSGLDMSSRFTDMKLVPSVRLVSPMTFIVRGKSGFPHVVEATQAEEGEPLQWYCSCGSREQCQHVRKTLFKINE